MSRFTTIFGVLFVLLGVIAYFATGQESITALIPAFFGVVFVVLGLVMRDESKIKHAGHAAAVLALLALIGSARGIPGAIAVAQGGEVERPEAAVSQAIMALLSVVFLVGAIKSFVDARKAREAQS